MKTINEIMKFIKENIENGNIFYIALWISAMALLIIGFSEV